MAERLPGGRPGFSGGDPAPAIPGTLELLRARGAEPFPWTAECDLLLAPYPAPGEQTQWLLDHLRRLPLAYPVALYERDTPVLPNLLVAGLEEDPEDSALAGLRAYRSAFRHAGRGAAEALVLLPARRLMWLLRGSFLAEGTPGSGSSLQNRRFLAHALDHQRSLMLLADIVDRPLETVGRTLVLAPHFDDESLLFGAAIAAATAAGSEVRLVWLTDGAAGIPGQTGPAAGAVRRAEAEGAAAELGVGDLHFLDAPETGLRARGPWTGTLRRLIADFQPERIHLPWWGDGHVDHFETNRVLLAALPRAQRCVEIAAGAFWTPLPSGASLPHSAAKDRALGCHRSQLATVDYHRAGRGLSRWNARDLPGVAHAERHLLLPAPDYLRRYRLSGASRRCYFGVRRQ